MRQAAEEACAAASGSGELEQRGRAAGGERGGGEAQRAERRGARAEAQRLAAGEAMRTVHQRFEHSMAAIGATGVLGTPIMGMSFSKLRLG